MTERLVLAAAAFALLVSGTTVVGFLGQEAKPVVEVYKSPT
jgi:hypothetical protein